MGGRGRGRGRGKSTITINDQAGLNTKDALPKIITQPPPMYPPLEYKAPEPQISTELSYLLELKRDIAESFHESINNVQLNSVNEDVKIFSDLYAEIMKNKVRYDEHVDWNTMPHELKPAKGKKRKSNDPQSNTKKKEVEIEKKLEKLEEEEAKNESEVEEEETKSDEEEEKEGEEDVEDEEMDEGTDYVNNYFDNGEGYDDEEDNLDDGPIY